MPPPQTKFLVFYRSKKSIKSKTFKIKSISIDLSSGFSIEHVVAKYQFFDTLVQ